MNVIRDMDYAVDGLLGGTRFADTTEELTLVGGGLWAGQRCGDLAIIKRPAVFLLHKNGWMSQSEMHRNMH